jgi:hypothetical protein
MHEEQSVLEDNKCTRERREDVREDAYHVRGPGAAGMAVIRADGRRQVENPF